MSENNEREHDGSEVGDMVLYNPADGRGTVEATVTRVRPGDGDAEPTIDITYTHPRDPEALATAERVRHGFGGFQWFAIAERPADQSPPVPMPTPSGTAATPAPGPSEREGELETQVAGMEQMIRRALGLEADSTGDDVREAIERDELGRLKSENTALHESNERLASRVADLEGQLAAKSTAAKSGAATRRK